MLLKSITRPTPQKNLIINICKKKTCLKFASTESEMHVPASGMPLKLYLEVHLGHVQAFGATVFQP